MYMRYLFNKAKKKISVFDLEFKLIPKIFSISSPRYYIVTEKKSVSQNASN